MCRHRYRFHMAQHFLFGEQAGMRYERIYGRQEQLRLLRAEAQKLLQWKIIKFDLTELVFPKAFILIKNKDLEKVRPAIFFYEILKN